MTFIMLRYVASMPTFWKVFFFLIINGCWQILLKYLSVSIEMTIGFQFVNMVYHIDWFAYGEESLYPWDKPHSIMVYDPLNVFLGLFAIILLRIFMSIFTSDIGL